MLTKFTINDETIYFEKNDKYKTVSFGMFTFTPFTTKFASERTILASILSKSNKIYPKEQDFNIYCQELYDTSINFKNTRIARTSLFNVLVNFINPSYVGEGKKLLFDVLKLLITNTLYPDITKEKVELEKSILINEINNVYNNKSQYAYQQFISHMFKDELISKKVNGTVDDVLKVSVESVNEAYLNILKYPRIFYITGDILEEDIKEFFSSVHLPKTNGDLSDIEFIDKETKDIIKVNEVIESQDISQSILCMGYRSNIMMYDDLYIPMCVFSAMLGGFFHSTLFQVIREEHSLAYSVMSDYNGRKGNMAIVCGIDKDKYNDVVNMVKDIINDYQNGIIDTENMELTKKGIINNTIKSEDSVSSSLYNVYNELVGIKNLTLEEKIKMVEDVTVDDIIKVANIIKLDTIYFLKGDKDEENN